MFGGRICWLCIGGHFMLVLYFCHFSGWATPLLYGACSFKVKDIFHHINFLQNIFNIGLNTLKSHIEVIFRLLSCKNQIGFITIRINSEQLAASCVTLTRSPLPWGLQTLGDFQNLKPIKNMCHYKQTPQIRKLQINGV